MKEYKTDYNKKERKTYKKIEKYSHDELKKEISKLNKYYKNKERDNILKLRDY